MKQKPNPTDFRYPQPLIVRVVSAAADQLYQIVWQPRVVRQTKQRRVGSLDFIDYTVPCFELARQLGLSTAELTEQLAEGLAEDDTSKELLKIEAVEGYLNFRLSDEYLAAMSTAAAEWLIAPATVAGAVHQTQILLADEHAENGKFSQIRDTANEYITEAYELLSERVTVSRPTADDSQDEVAAVHAFLDMITSLGDASNGLIRDVATGAVYCLQGDTAWPVRSAKGRLYPEAHLIYALNQLYITALSSQAQNTVLVLAPQQLHPFIRHAAVYMELSHKNEPVVPVICFDPSVSFVDVTQLSQSSAQIKDRFSTLATMLAATSDKALNQPNLRAAMLFAASLPVELSEFVEHHQLAALFDVLNQLSDFTIPIL